MLAVIVITLQNFRLYTWPQRSHAVTSRQNGHERFVFKIKILEITGGNLQEKKAARRRARL